MDKRKLSWPVSAVVLCAGGVMVVSPAAVGALSPDVVFGVVDDDLDGVPDSFSSPALADAVFTRFDDQRSFSEYTLAGADGPVVESAVFSGTIEEAFSFGFGTSPAELVFEVYAANGAADLSDFAVAAVEIGSLTLVEDFDAAGFSFDAADALQGVLDGGASHVGVRVRFATADAGEVDVVSPELDASFVPAPGAVALMGVGGLVAVRRRR